MKKFITFIILAFSLSWSFAQVNPIDFEAGGNGASWTWTVFENGANLPLEIMANPVSGTGNTTATVAKFTVLDTGMDWAGSETLDITEFTFDANNCIVKLWVYKDVASQVKVKFEGTSAPVESFDIVNSTTGQWEEMTFDFTSVIGNTYNKLVFFPDFAPRDQDNVVYFDNITFSAPTEPTVAAPDPTQDQADVISMFSGVYADVAVDTWLTGWSVGVLEDVMIAGNATKKYSALDFAGIETTGANLIDASGMSHFSLDMWTPEGNDFKVKLVDFGADGAWGGGDDTEHEIVYAAPSTGAWISYDIPLSDFTGLGSTSHIAQLILSKPTLGTIFVDNIYFYNEVLPPTEPTVAAPDPTQDQADVISMFSDVYTDVAVDTWLTGWSVGVLEDVMIAGNATKKYSALDFAGIETTGANLIDASGMSHFSLDMWTPEGNDFKVKLVDFGADGAWGGGDDTEHEIIYPAPSTGTWISYDIPLSDFTGLGSTSHIAQLILSKPTSGTIFVDNIYFYNEVLPPTEPTVAAPDPTQDAADVISMFSDVYTDVAVDTWLTGWSVGVLEDVMIAGNATKKYSALDFAGVETTGANLIDASGMSHFSLDMWTPEGNDFKVKLVDFGADGAWGGGDDTEHEIIYPAPSTGTWISYDIPLSDFTGLGSTSHIAQLILSKPTLGTIFVDNIYFYNEVAPPTEPTVAAPIPTHASEDVASIYSDSYTDLAGTDFNPGWGQTTLVTFEDLGGNGMMKYANFNYQGTQFSASQDVSVMEFMHVDIWTADATVVKVTPISATTGEFLLELTPLNQGSWNSYDIPVGDFAGVSMSDIHQLKFDGQEGVTPSTLFIDNIYFWKNPTAAGSDATLSDLQVDGSTVSGFDANTLNYDVELPNGTTVVPTVTATTTDPNAGHAVTDAAGLPGTTSVEVTADDGVTILIYNVNFSIADLVPTAGAPLPVHDEVNDNVVSVYSDSYTNIASTNFDPNWGQSTVVTVDDVIGGNNTLVYTNLNYQGTNLGSTDGSPQDFSAQDYIHIDFWTPNATTLNIFLISQTTGEIPYSIPITINQWESIDIPLTHFSGQGLDLSDIFQFKVDGGDGSTKVYFDNWYFWKVSASTDASLSDLQVDGTAIAGFAPDMLSYDVEVPVGTTVVPTVTATTLNPNATYAVIDAAGLPGTTEVVVTAEDGATSLSYLVNFIFPDAAPLVAAPIPSQEDQYVISIYSDTYTDLTGTDFNPGWGQTTVVTTEDIAGNEMMKYDNFNYQGTQLAGNQDLSIMEFMHVDIWTDDATIIQVTPISATTGEFLVSLTPLNQGAWNSYDIPVGDFTGVSMADIHQFKFDGQAGVNPSTIYLDNIYFWKNPPAAGTDASLSDLQVDGTTIPGFSPSILSYNMELPFGTTIVPTVTATTNDLGANYIIDDATVLPGTTSVEVTAEDGITILTYLVNFTLEDAVPTEGAPNPVHDESLHNVFSIYSGSYTNLENSNFNPNWGQSTQVLIDEQIGGNNTLVYTNLNYQGTNLGSADGSPQDVSVHDYLHIDFWSPDASALNFFLISQGSGEIAYSLPISNNEWVGVNIPLSYFSNEGLDLTDIYQFKIDGGDGSVTVYFDNWYFWNVIEGGDATLSDLQVDGETVNGFNPDVFNYDVELPQGTTTVPTVTATTSDNNATYVVNDASGIPGTTEVIITAQDGTTIFSYYVNFLLPDAMPLEAAPTPIHVDENVISMFSDTYTDVEVDTWLTDWSVAVLEDIEIQGNPTKKYSSMDFVGVETVNSPLDLESADMLYFHLDYWTSNSTALRIKLVDFGGDGYGGGNDSEAELEFTPVLSEWNSLDIPLEDFVGMNMNDINQLIFSSNPAGESVIFIDNVFYYKDPVGIGESITVEMNVYPNPTRDYWYIQSNEIVHDIQVFDLAGRLVITLQPEMSGIIKIDGSELNRGLYLIKVNGSRVQEFKLIKD